MLNNEGPKLNQQWKGYDFWKNEIRAADIPGLRHFNDVLTGEEAPAGYGEPVIQDVMLDGKNCDIYHTDKRPTDSGNRIFIHIKE